jgi:mono/diheme cytochrome c family protein
MPSGGHQACGGLFLLKRVLKWVRRTAIVLAGLVVLAVAILYILTERQFRRHYDVTAQALTIPDDAATLARGKHLVDNVTNCHDCHAKDLGGRVIFDGGVLVARLAGPNLTRGKGGIGAHYSDADWVRALKHGLRRDGSPLIVMPSQWFARLPASDMAAMIAYLKTLPPVDREMPAVAAGPLGRLMVLREPKLIPAQIIDHAQPLAAAAPVELVARGEHLASIAGCRSCHKSDLVGGDGPPPGSSNITPVGIGSWTKGDFFRTLRTGRTPDNRTLSETMPRALGNMSDEELDAIWAYLKTVPPKGEKTERQRQTAQAVAQAGNADSGTR